MSTMAPAADLEADDRRHKREEEARRAKRKEARENKSAAQIEKEQRRREHAQRVLKEQNLKRQQDPRSSSSALRKPSKASSRPSSSSSGGVGGGADLGGSSVFQSLFSKRAEGFLIDLNFRNAPPRPPVGPCFVGLGLDGELNDKWTRYKPFNAVETNYSWKLHAEPDLGVPLAPSAMDLEGCYTDPTKPNKKQKFDAMDDDNDHNDDDDNDDNENGQSNKPEPPPLHPDDAALIHWKGSLGDTAAEELQIRRDRARAAARLQGMNGGKKLSSQQQLSTPTSDRTLRRAKGSSTKDFKSRVLDEQNPFFMKKTTYLANDQSQSVHTFKSLAQTKAETAKEIEKKLHENTHRISDKDAIEQTFQKHLPPPPSSTTPPPRVHPNKRNVTALYEIPLLPDVSTWGHTYTHVVLDNLPKEAPRRPAPTPEQLRNAFIADVERREQNLRMECNLLTPNDVAASSSSEPTSFDVSQVYDLDVVPLKEEDSPHVNFLIMVDEEKKVATYHPISSRVMLSMGRPADRHAGTTIIAKRALNAEDVDEMEKRIAEVDMDCAQKHGMLEEDDPHPTMDQDGGKHTDDDDDDDENEEDHREQGMTMSSTTQKRENPFGAMSDSSDSDGGF